MRPSPTRPAFNSEEVGREGGRKGGRERGRGRDGGRGKMREREGGRRREKEEGYHVNHGYVASFPGLAGPKKGGGLPEARGMEMKATAASNKALRLSILIPNHLEVTR